MKYLETFNENLLRFSYKGTEFPNQEMKDWIDLHYPTNHDTMDDLDSILTKIL